MLYLNTGVNANQFFVVRKFKTMGIPSELSYINWYKKIIAFRTNLHIILLLCVTSIRIHERKKGISLNYFHLEPFLDYFDINDYCIIYISTINFLVN